MRGSAKGGEPAELSDWKKSERACAGLEPRYDALSGDARKGLQRALFFEQTGQCVYCGRGIRLEDRGGFHVEHFRPSARWPELELAYENLFLSCESDRRRQDPSSGTCGHRKDDWFDEACYVAPAPEEECQQRFAFGSNGRIRGDGTPAAEEMIAVLNLNHPELVADRSQLIEAVDAELEKVGPGELVQNYSAVAPDGTRGSFAHVAVRYLDRFS